jgi:hypothetical protein
MKVVSFDIGINNLSYIKLDFTDQKYTIYDWKTISLFQPEKILLCCHKLKKKNNICNKRAKFFINDEHGEKLCYCGIHSKILDEKKVNKKVNKIVKKKKKKKTLQEICIKLNETLDSLNLCDVEYVLLEQQPQKNAQMKNISLLIFNYFILRGIIDKPINKIKDVLFISSKNKLKYYDGPEIIIKSKNNYTKRKKLAIEYCKYHLQNYEEDLNYFLSLKKKDDAADCFLQAVWFFHK